ncbi:hypothetical protein M9Y10_027119 [Tritrichomonas musculus]|uniref:Uncharacterized protein n=1 Tax=Tritrichomonas musculus TaxID=1915356 RepID=A0ABR2H5R1_9EUKA
MTLSRIFLTQTRTCYSSSTTLKRRKQESKFYPTKKLGNGLLGSLREVPITDSIHSIGVLKVLNKRSRHCSRSISTYHVLRKLFQKAIKTTRIFLILVFFVCNLLQGPARTLCSDACPPGQRVLISSIVGIYGGFGGVFKNLIGALSLYQYTSLSQEQFILVGCLCISFAAVLLTVIVTREEQLNEKPASSNPFAVFLQALKDISPPFLRIALAYFFTMIVSYQIGFQLTPFMGKVIYKGENLPDTNYPRTIAYQKGVSWAMLCNVVSCGVQFIYCFFQSKICDLIGLKFISLLL